MNHFRHVMANKIEPERVGRDALNAKHLFVDFETCPYNSNNVENVLTYTEYIFRYRLFLISQKSKYVQGGKGILVSHGEKGTVT
jgi:hypothetical protein